MTSQADLIEECAPCWTATRVARGPMDPDSVCRMRAAERAATRAERLPIVPPGTNTPPASGGSPARSAIQRRATFSAKTAPAPSSQDPA